MTDLDWQAAVAATGRALQWALLLVGGTGGVLYWWDRWRDRPRLRFESTTLRFYGSPPSGADLEATLLNVGSKRTAIMRQITGTALTKDRQRIDLTFAATEGRELEPHTITNLRARLNRPVERAGEGWPFRHIAVRLTTGGKARVYSIPFNEGPASAAEYWLWRTWFLFQLPGYDRWFARRRTAWEARKPVL